MFRAQRGGEQQGVSGPKEGLVIYIGIGTIVLIVIIVLVVLALRRW
jgi:hypothetical protein